MTSTTRSIRYPLLALASLGTALLAAPSAGQAQSGPELMKRAIEVQSERLADVEDVTLTQNVMGMDVTVYMEKQELDGVPTLVPITTIMGGTTTPIPQDQREADWSNPFQEDWAQRTRLEGDDQVDGHAVKVLVMDDFNGLELPGLPTQGGQQDFKPSLIRFYLDADEMVIRKMDVNAEVSQQGGTPTPVEMTMFMEDYRTVDGFTHPFRTRTLTKGMMGAMDVDQEEVRAQLEELKKQLANMPESQRAMMEGMLKPQMEQLEAMMGSGGDAMELTITVTDLKVNAGPPGGGV